MKALVIGANSFLGRNIVKKCLERNWELDCVYHHSKQYIPTSCNIIHVSDLKNCNQDYNVVFLTAGNFAADIKSLTEANVTLPLIVVNRFISSKIVFISSTMVYGIHQTPIYESSPFNSPNIYGMSKIAGEFILQASTNSIIVRFTALYGREMNKNLFLYRAIRDAKEKKVITIYGNGSRLQDYLHVSDAAEICLKVVSKKANSIYLCVSGKSYSNLEVAKIIQGYVYDCKIEFTGTDNSPSFVYNNEFTRNELGFSPSYSLDIGIKEMLEYE